MVKLPEYEEISQPDLTNCGDVLCLGVLSISVTLARWVFDGRCHHYVYAGYTGVQRCSSLSIYYT